MVLPFILLSLYKLVLPHLSDLVLESPYEIDDLVSFLCILIASFIQQLLVRVDCFLQLVQKRRILILILEKEIVKAFELGFLDFLILDLFFEFIDIVRLKR